MVLIEFLSISRAAYARQVENRSCYPKTEGVLFWASVIVKANSFNPVAAPFFKKCVLLPIGRGIGQPCLSFKPIF